MLHRQLLAIAPRVGRPILVNVTLSLLVSACAIAQALLAAQFLHRLLTADFSDGVVASAAGLVGVVGVRAGLLWLSELAAQRTAHFVKQRIRTSLFEKLLSLGPGFVTGRRSGDLTTTMVDGVEALEAYFARYLPAVVVALVVPAGVLAGLAVIDPWSAAVIASAVVFMLAGPRLWDRMLARAGDTHWAGFSRLSADYLDATQGMTTLKAFNATSRTRADLQVRGEVLRKASMRHLGVSLVDSGFTTFALLAGPAVAVGWGALRVANGELSPLTLLTVLLLGREALRPFADLSKHWHAGYLGVTASKDIHALLVAEPSVVTSAVHHHKPAVLSPTIEFDRVSFSYPGRDTAVLTNFSLRIEAGETVALVGTSGAGKSTVVALLLRYFDPADGRVLLGGVELGGLSPEEVRKQVAVVAQDTYLFTGTIAANLRLGRPDATDGELRAAAAAAYADEFISALPQGYDTEVGERGATLSGGQRQRIAIARALLKDAPILVLDEATSNVDSAGEAKVQQALVRAAAGRTTLVIAHRLSTIRSADRIVLLHEGGIEAIGSHAEILRAGGSFERLAEDRSRP